MPSGPEARRLAAAAEANAALSAIRCVVRLLEATASPGCERQLLAVIDQALVRAERATRILGGGGT
jgi:hypothetical protein